MKKYQLITLFLLLGALSACNKSDNSATSAQPQAEPKQQEVKTTFRSKAATDKLTPKELPVLGTSSEQLNFQAKDAEAVLSNKPRPTSPIPLAVLAGNPPPDVDVCNLPFSALTKAIFENCAEQGMSYIQTANTFGFSGELTTEAGNSKTYTWKSREGIVAITFVDDGLTSKTQTGLK